MINRDSFFYLAPQAGDPIVQTSMRAILASRVDVSIYNPSASFSSARGQTPTIEELADYVAAIRLIEADAIMRRLAEGDAA